MLTESPFLGYLHFAGLVASIYPSARQQHHQPVQQAHHQWVSEFWGSLLACDKTLQIKKNTLRRAISAFKVLSEDFFCFTSRYPIKPTQKIKIIIRTNCLICCEDGLILDPKSTYVLCSLKMIRSSIQLRACHNISVQQSLRYSDLILVFSEV